MRASDVMSINVSVAWPDTSVQEIARRLCERQVSALPVVDAEDRVLGIVSEGDLMRRVELGTDVRRSWWLDLLSSDASLAGDYVKAHGRTARDVMTRPVITVDEATDLKDVARLLESKHIKRVPVLRGGKLVGVVSRADIIRGLIAAGAGWPRARTRDDASIRTAIQEELRKLPFAVGAHANAIVEDGIVHLWGHVETPEQRNGIRVAVENIPGVKQVVDNMKGYRLTGVV